MGQIVDWEMGTVVKCLGYKYFFDDYKWEVEKCNHFGANYGCDTEEGLVLEQEEFGLAVENRSKVEGNFGVGDKVKIFERVLVRG